MDHQPNMDTPLVTITFELIAHDEADDGYVWSRAVRLWYHVPRRGDAVEIGGAEMLAISGSLPDADVIEGDVEDVRWHDGGVIVSVREASPIRAALMLQQLFPDAS